MSMWEIESLVEAGVQFVARQTQWSVQDRRSHYASLYTLQNQYDCSYTHFRCLDVLERDGFLFQVPLEQHPAFAADPDALRQTAETFGWVPMDPKDPGGPSAGLYTSAKDVRASSTDEKRLYFDITSPMWQHAVAAGLVEGHGAAPFDLWDSVDTVARMIQLAADTPNLQDDHDAKVVLKGFYGFGGLYLAYEPEPPAPGRPLLDRALASPAIAAVVTSPVEDWIDERFPPPTLPGPDESGLANPSFVAFWRTPLGS